MRHVTNISLNQGLPIKELGSSCVSLLCRRVVGELGSSSYRREVGELQVRFIEKLKSLAQARIVENLGELQVRIIEKLGELGSSSYRREFGEIGSSS